MTPQVPPTVRVHFLVSLSSLQLITAVTYFQYGSPIWRSPLLGVVLSLSPLSLSLPSKESKLEPFQSFCCDSLLKEKRKMLLSQSLSGVPALGLA